MNKWIYFLKNSEVKDNFKAKGLKEANEVFDIMRLPKDDQFGYNRYLDALHLKASEMFSLQTEADFKVKEEIVVNAIKKGFDNYTISELTGLSVGRIEVLRNVLELKAHR